MTDICIAYGGDLSLPSGGASRITHFSKELSKSGFDVTIVCPRAERELPDIRDGVIIEEISGRDKGLISQPLNGLLVTRKAKQISEETGATIHFVHSSLAGIGTLIGCSDFVLDMHDLVYPQDMYGDLPGGKIIQRGIYTLERRAVRKAEEIVVVSTFLESTIRDEWSVPESKVSVVPNGYSKELIDDLTLSADEGTVVFLGTLHDKVNLDALQDVAQLPECERLIIIGGGAYLDDLTNRLNGDREPSVNIMGWLEPREAFQVVASATVAIAPYYQSRQYRVSSPVKLYAYAGIGIPTIVTRGPEITDCLMNEGAAVAVDDNDKFAEAVRDTLTDEDVQESLSRNAKEIANRFTWKERGKQLVDLYQSKIS